MNNRINTIFYSRKCPISKTVIQLLNDEELLGYFKLYCIDDMPRASIPKQISHVPFMILNTVQRPLQGKEILQWIQSTRFLKQQKTYMQKEAVRRNMIRFAMLNKKGHLGYNNDEMEGYSDNYAYTNVDAPQTKSFMGWGQENKHAIFTGPEANKMTADESKKAINSEKSLRDNQDNYKNELYKKQHAITYLNEQENNTNN